MMRLLEQNKARASVHNSGHMWLVFTINSAVLSLMLLATHW